MPEINISDHIFTGGKRDLSNIIDWLGDNVGEYYGIGDHPVMRIGAGWEIKSIEEWVEEGISIHWVVDITDEQKAMLFALKWGA